MLMIIVVQILLTRDMCPLKSFMGIIFQIGSIESGNFIWSMDSGTLYHNKGIPRWHEDVVRWHYSRQAVIWTVSF